MRRNVGSGGNLLEGCASRRSNAASDGTLLGKKRLCIASGDRLNAHHSGIRHSVLRDAEQSMDRIDAMKVFVTALDEGSLAGAARKLGRSAAAVSRAVAVLEGHVGVQPLHRTTRLIKLSEAGKRYAVGCRRMLTDLEEADILAAARDRPDCVEFPARPRLDAPAHRAVHPALCRQQRARGGRLGCRGARCDAGVLLSGRPACTGRPVADFAEVGRARPVAGSYRHAAGSAFRSEGSRLRRLRRAALAGAVRAPRRGCGVLIRR